MNGYAPSGRNRATMFFRARVQGKDDYSAPDVWARRGTDVPDVASLVPAVLTRLASGGGLRPGAAERPGHLLGGGPSRRHRRLSGFQDFALGGQPMLLGFAIAATGRKPDLVGAFADAVG